MIRTGVGYDVHKIVKGVPLIVGGVKIDSDFGCVSNTDGDALTHAIIDALLGASGKNDIGFYFPPTDECKNVSSLSLLKKTLKIISKFEIINIDSVVVLQNPILSPYREKIIGSLASTCEIEKSRINVKFKTEEQLGFTGNLEGIKSFSVVLANC